jgi:hypothetical protein
MTAEEAWTDGIPQEMFVKDMKKMSADIAGTSTPTAGRREKVPQGTLDPVSMSL